MHAQVTGIVLTLDSWLLMANNLIDDVLAKAVTMSAAKDPNITQEDRKPILFCAIADLEDTLATASEATFEAAIDRAVAERRLGWRLSSSHDEVRPDGVARRSYPFGQHMADVLPWWNWLKEERERRAE